MKLQLASEAPGNKANKASKMAEKMRSRMAGFVSKYVRSAVAAPAGINYWSLCSVSLLSSFSPVYVFVCGAGRRYNSKAAGGSMEETADAEDEGLKLSECVCRSHARVAFPALIAF